jgi:DNA-binding SARP family transcriptional activator
MRDVTGEAMPRDAYRRIFESLPGAVVVLDPSGAVVRYNPSAAAIFGRAIEQPGVRCCDLFGCGRGGEDQPIAFHCVTVAALERGGPLEALTTEVGGRTLSVMAAPLPDGAGAVVEVRALGAPSHVNGTAPQILRITTLGDVGIEIDQRPLGGEWLHHRPGRLFKYLICARGHRVPTEELIEALWPGSGRSGMPSLRQAVHALRDRLEPTRTRHAQSRFILARAGAYELDLTDVWIDADEFETEARAALLSLERWGAEAAEPQLTRAAGLYGGDFLADEPYADWVLGERDRLRDLAARILRELANLHLDTGSTDDATEVLQRLADLEPLDLHAQRDLIALMIQRGRHADAARRYELVRRRFRHAFDQDPDFALSELAERA